MAQYSVSSVIQGLLGPTPTRSGSQSMKVSVYLAMRIMRRMTRRIMAIMRIMRRTSVVEEGDVTYSTRLSQTPEVFDLFNTSYSSRYSNWGANQFIAPDDQVCY